eukprot:CAMPEP_0115047116 /NCGR_PEP_ID=MMETSP0216-20121206/49132_1 /TAXON_ID=223996 /ORGANISM="Protocruzia adherens, Strain Boccale" /LENGTH=79 /DNA_ID=CAMNT_0002430285 /DNA_START=214 /DNA_END=453 /DNA_ORIENTATION=-
MENFPPNIRDILLKNRNKAYALKQDTESLVPQKDSSTRSGTTLGALFAIQKEDDKDKQKADKRIKAEDREEEEEEKKEK